jgi:hypothetical protein
VTALANLVVLLVFVVLIIKDGDVTITEINKQK